MRLCLTLRIPLEWGSKLPHHFSLLPYGYCGLEREAKGAIRHIGDHNRNAVDPVSRPHSHGSAVATATRREASIRRAVQQRSPSYAPSPCPLRLVVVVAAGAAWHVAVPYFRRAYPRSIRADLPDDPGSGSSQ